MMFNNLFTKKKKYKKQIFFNFKVLERQSKIRRLFKIPLPPITFKKEYWL